MIDVPAGYRKPNAAFMIAPALARGLRRGWLFAAPRGAALARARYAIRSRMSCAGALMDALMDGCAGTGKQDSLLA